MKCGSLRLQAPWMEQKSICFTMRKFHLAAIFYFSMPKWKTIVLALKSAKISGRPALPPVLHAPPGPC